ncbi:tetratricopeptide repeat protein [Parvularcula marina]|uniref:Tetratricopeptide repeat protein n=1 Tax=Parvularcula marina TaxID=2292771 RepID=A0A371RHC8_9PROT|nr:tetratricopeptide repeat protein [Parvularcula marina]RFB04835.1 tetratricopeptide repeat protein [Parvularcula marina]
MTENQTQEEKAGEEDLPADGVESQIDDLSPKTRSQIVQDFIRSRVVRWSAAGVAFVGAVSFFGNFATIVSMFQPSTASSKQVEDLQSELAAQRLMIAQLLEQTAPSDPAELSPSRVAERRDAAMRVANADPAAAQAIANGDFRTGFRALQARADDLSADAAIAWRDLGALAYDRDPAIALEAYQQAARIDPGHYETWIALSALEYEQNGDVRAAKAAAASAADVADDLDKRLTALSELAFLEFEAGELELARQRFQQILQIVRPLNEAEPGNDEYLLILADTLEGLADVEAMLGDPNAARTSHEEVLVLRRQRLAAQPDEPARRRDLSSALESAGELALEAGDFPRAEALFAESLAIDRQLATNEPDSLRAQRNLAVSLEMYGDVLMELERPAEALSHYRESLQISRLLMASHPLNAQFREDVAFSLAQTGGAYRAVGNDQAAKATFIEMLAIMRGLAGEQETVLRGELLLAEALARTADGTGDDAYAEEARGIIDRLKAEGRYSPEVRALMADAEAILYPAP